MLDVSESTSAYVWLGWSLCGFVMLGVLYAMWPANTGQALPSLGWAVVYGALSRTLWAAGLSWIVIASVAGYGGVVTKLLSFGALMPLSRLTYSAYIIHPVVMAIFYGSREEVFDFSPFLLTYFTLGNVTLSYGISFVLSLLFEAPVLALEKALLGRK
ncbi:nose resistant to fluoxetine protein 6 [Ixodes scapularis]